MFRYKFLISIFCLGLILGIPAPAWSLDSLIVNIDEAAAIVNPMDQNDVRILLKFDPLTSLDTNDVVMIAELRSAVNIVNAPDHSILLHANPIETNWNANSVGWSTPWTNSGGDIAEDLSVLGQISVADSQNVRLDVTRIIQRIVSGHIENYGLMLRQVGELKRPFAIRTSNPPNRGNPLVELAVYFVNRN